MADKTKILIVEDDTPLAMMMVHVLSCAGCEVLVAFTGKRGLTMAHESEFDLITLDIDLPDIDGFEICSELKQRHLSCHTPVVFISRQPCEEDMRRGLEAGAADYIARPFGAGFAPRLLSHVRRKQAVSH